MATLKSIRKRIISVKNTQKITKAMKMVAAAKLRRAQTAVISARPYAARLSDILRSILAREDVGTHPLFVERDHPKRASFLIFTSNRGLCGGFNSNLLRKTETHLQRFAGSYELIDLSVIGKKGRDFYKARRRETKNIFLNYAESFPFAEAKQVTADMVSSFLSGTYDECFIVYNQFRSALSQAVEVERILPLPLPSKTDEAGSGKGLERHLIDFIYEPNKREVLDLLIPHYMASLLYKAHLESIASELGARMTAMENATHNASDMIGKLTLQYNRVRQAAITKELMDIVNGAEAIK